MPKNFHTNLFSLLYNCYWIQIQLFYYMSSVKCKLKLDPINQVSVFSSLRLLQKFTIYFSIFCYRLCNKNIRLGVICNLREVKMALFYDFYIFLCAQMFKYGLPWGFVRFIIEVTSWGEKYKEYEKIQVIQSRNFLYTKRKSFSSFCQHVLLYIYFFEPYLYALLLHNTSIYFIIILHKLKIFGVFGLVFIIVLALWLLGR